MKTELTIGQIFECNRVIAKLEATSSKFSINTGFKIYNIRKAFDDVEEYVFKLMEKLINMKEKREFIFDNLKDSSSAEYEIYSGLANNMVTVDFEKLKSEDLTGDCQIKLSLKEIETLNDIICLQE